MSNTILLTVTVRCVVSSPNTVLVSARVSDSHLTDVIWEASETSPMLGVEAIEAAKPAAAALSKDPQSMPSTTISLATIAGVGAGVKGSGAGVGGEYTIALVEGWPLFMFSHCLTPSVVLKPYTLPLISPTMTSKPSSLNAGVDLISLSVLALSQSLVPSDVSRATTAPVPAYLTPT